MSKLKLGLGGVLYQIVKAVRYPKVFIIKKRLGHCGKDVVISMPCRMSLPQNVYMGDYTLIQPNCTFVLNNGEVHIGKWTAISHNTTIITTNHVPTVGINHRMLGRYHINDKDLDIRIGEDCWVGSSVTLMSGASMGRGSIAAAGALVNKPVPPYAVVAGVPAKIIASVFSKEQIIKHEECLYPESKRMTTEQIDELFKNFFEGKRHIGIDSISDKDRKSAIDHSYMQEKIPE